MMQRGIAVAASVALAACERVPSINLLGAFFPSWMACILIGIALTLVAQRALAASGIESSIGPRALIYPALALAVTLGAWVAFFRG
jgi:Na+/phosphate symporter